MYLFQQLVSELLAYSLDSARGPRLPWSAVHLVFPAYLPASLIKNLALSGFSLDELAYLELHMHVLRRARDLVEFLQYAFRYLE